MIELALLTLSVYVLASHPPFTEVGWGEFESHPFFKKHPGQDFLR